MVKLRFTINNYDLGNWWDDREEYEVEITRRKAREKENKKKKEK